MNIDKSQRCLRCQIEIYSEDKPFFRDKNLCKSCYENDVTDQNINLFVLCFAVLFFIPPADLIFDFGLEYGFFMLLRVAAFTGFAYLAYKNIYSQFKIADLNISIIFGGIAILYNPFFPIELTRFIWTPINIGTGVFLLGFFNQQRVMRQFITDTEIQIKNTTGKHKNIPKNNLEDTKARPLEPEPKPEKENVLGAAKLIIDPLLVEKSLMEPTTGYLDSDEALGFVAGFSDGFLQSSAKHFGLEGTDEDLAMVTVLEVVFEGTNNSADRFYELQTEDNEGFFAAQMQGGEQAFALLDKLKTASFSKDMQIGWLKEYNHWLDKRGKTENSSKWQISALENLFEPVEMLIDFVKRLDHVGDEELAALMVWTTKERLKFFEMSPDAHLWFSEPKKEHLEDLLNYQSASYVKIKALQSSGKTMEASFHMIMLHLATGILHRRTDHAFSEAAINMWITIRERSRNHIADAIERHLEEHEDKDAFLAELYSWQPKALLDPIEDE